MDPTTNTTATTNNNPIQTNYDQNATTYNQFLSTPLGLLEQQLFTLSMPNCTNQTVLDLGGGTGSRARDALHAGASLVDVIDISPTMMQTGQHYHTQYPIPTNPSGKINWYVADVSKPLDDQLSPLSSLSSTPSPSPSSTQLGPYDLVIANGIFDHAQTTSELETMWSNAAKHLKPGGRIIANRNNPLSIAAKNGKYGVTLSDFKPLSTGDHGFSYTYHIHTNPPLIFQSTALDVYYKGSLDIPGKWFGGFRNLRWEDTDVVKGDMGFWSEFLDDPILFIFEAWKT